MARTHAARPRGDVSSFLCGSCGTTSLRWVGRCPACGEWNTLGQAPAQGRGARRGAAAFGRAAGESDGEGAAVALADVPTDAARPLRTGVSELDRVLGGGVVGGSATLLFGPPGIGKSTLLFQVLASVAGR
ncbi:MAG TPA: hypothetical protein VHD39_03100, partial [Acidimicrobiales bacterium]|nr:hypothetical protein [Acidimicrobiales bacterium]